MDIASHTCGNCRYFIKASWKPSWASDSERCHHFKNTEMQSSGEFKAFAETAACPHHEPLDSVYVCPEHDPEKYYCLKDSEGITWHFGRNPFMDEAAAPQIRHAIPFKFKSQYHEQ